MQVISNLVKSRKFWLTFIGVGSVIAGQYFGVDEETITKIVSLIGILVAAIAGEDMAEKIGLRNSK